MRSYNKSGIITKQGMPDQNLPFVKGLLMNNLMKNTVEILKKVHNPGMRRICCSIGQPYRHATVMRLLKQTCILQNNSLWSLTCIGKRRQTVVVFCF